MNRKMWNKLKFFVICAMLVKCSHCQNPDPGKAISLDKLIEDSFKPVNEFGTTPDFNTQRPPTTVTSAPPTPPPSAFQCPNGECVAHYLCNGNQLNTDGRGVLDLKFSEQNGPQEGEQKCYDYWQTCCRFGDITNKPVVTTPPTPLECGYRNRNGISYQTANNRNQSEYGEFPWMVAIIRDDPTLPTQVFLAGGSIIHPSVILTAAHYVLTYVSEERRIIVRAGEWDTQTPNELIPHQDRRASRIIVHERFNSENLHNDIALVILESPLVLNDVIQPICLPPQNQIFDYSRCVASGWGKNEFGKKGKYSVILKKVDLTVIPHQSCQDSLRTTRLGRRFILDPSFICAGGEVGVDTCRGDGGSPLVCPIQFGAPDRYYQAGVVAWGIGCGDGIPGVYTNVALFRSWINQQLTRLQFETGYYEL